LFGRRFSILEENPGTASYGLCIDGLSETIGGFGKLVKLMRVVTVDRARKVVDYPRRPGEPPREAR
jgi:hypothetical protein